ncbi:MAG: cyclic pyranopterin phosphate synthase MoaA [Candidatus Rokuibacteriota bacterium]|nr:MAG: cyclic pyranopterin phosphate synthase MoaA [Candidatus Rokubacteria bacterium]
MATPTSTRPASAPPTSGCRGITSTSASRRPVSCASGSGRGPRTPWRPERSRRPRPERVDESRGHVRAPAPESPDLGDRPLPREQILHFEEMGALVDVFMDLGVDKIRLTGGEPLLRRDLPELVRLLVTKPRLRDLAMTTNGVLLAEQARALKSAGLHRVTVSLDTLRPDRFTMLTRRTHHAQVLDGIAALGLVGFGGTKLDTVVMRSVNDDELADLIEYGRSVSAEVRFIEYMDVGGATRWSMDRVVSRAEMLEVLGRRYGTIEPIVETSSAPADRYRLADGTVFGIISSTTAPFCASCDRSRLTADGMWYLCLYAQRGIDLRGPLRGGATADDLKALIASAWTRRADRGAEERLKLRERTPLVQIGRLREDPHLEMHTRGG